MLQIELYAPKGAETLTVSSSEYDLIWSQGLCR